MTDSTAAEPVDRSPDGPLVSVIVPVYQVDAHLDECVASLAAQTHRNLEIILVDDGSTDGSGRLCDQWAQRDARVRAIHTRNGGLSTARNRGLDLATGDFISFVDGDDVVSPRYVATLLEAALTTRAEGVLADLVTFTDGGSEPAYREGREVRVEAAGEALTRIVTSGIGFASCGKLVAAEVFSGLRFRPGSDFEDLEILPRLVSRCSTFAVSDAAHYGYRQHEGSLMAGHRRLLRPSILHVLRSNIEFTQGAVSDPEECRTLVLGYVLHAMKTLEAASPASTRRAPGYDHEYRRFMAPHLRAVMTSAQISAPYKAAALVSVASPALFVRAIGAARRLKTSVAPGLRRRSGPRPTLVPKEQKAEP